MKKQIALFLLCIMTVLLPQSVAAQTYDVQFKYDLKPLDSSTNTTIRNSASMGEVRSNVACTEVGTSTTKCAVTGKLAGWPTDGLITQGPQGATSHNNIYVSSGTKSQPVDIGAILAKPIPNVYPTFTSIVKEVHDCHQYNDCNRSYGSYVQIGDSANTFTILYGHLEKIFVQQGANLTRKEAIGHMGTTGNSTGIHLHWEFRNIPLAVPNIPDNITPPNCDGGCKAGASGYVSYDPDLDTSDQEPAAGTKQYWFVLDRPAKREYLYYGEPGNKQTSELKKVFTVNPGKPGEFPTPLPQKLGRQYWLITNKRLVAPASQALLGNNFMVLDIPYQGRYSGPEPYLECGPNRNQQCDWTTPGEFGLHGIGTNPNGLTEAGSSGCVRHTNEEAAEIYNLLDFSNGPIRYYIEDNTI